MWVQLLHNGDYQELERMNLQKAWGKLKGGGYFSIDDVFSVLTDDQMCNIINEMRLDSELCND
jgi:hypothetical protein